MHRVVIVVLAAIALVSAVGSSPVLAQSTQKQYRLIRRGEGPLTLQLVDAPVRQPGANEVLVKVMATSLNRRDLSIAEGSRGDRKLVPLSDGAGEVVAIGRSVRRFKVGDRVAATFFQNWSEGRPDPDIDASALGGGIDGMLAQYVTLSEQGLVTIPAHLSYEEAATLPCAGVTAWNALVTRGHIRSNDFVLLQGTGGVSMFGLQFAVAHGARAIVTSSSDQKLARARELGAVALVNYRTTPDWEKPVREATGGRGIDHVIEVGGAGTLKKSLASIAPGGHIALVGGLSGWDGEIPADSLVGGNVTVSGIYVGSRADFESMNAFMTKHSLRPLVDRVFEWHDAQAAFDYMRSGSHFGKLVIRVAH